MSYALALAGDALPDLRSLEPWLQEEVLDEMEALAAHPTVLPPAPEGEIVYAFSRAASGVKHYVAATVGRNDGRRMLTVLGISHRTLNLPPDA